MTVLSLTWESPYLGKTVYILGPKWFVMFNVTTHAFSIANCWPMFVDQNWWLKSDIQMWFVKSKFNTKVETETLQHPSSLSCCNFENMRGCRFSSSSNVHQGDSPSFLAPRPVCYVAAGPCCAGLAGSPAGSASAAWDCSAWHSAQLWWGNIVKQSF